MDLVMVTLIDEMKSQSTYYKFMRDIVNLKTEQDYIKFTLNIMLENDYIPMISRISKSAEDSNRIRVEANGIFLRNSTDIIQCINAMLLYTQSIGLAPDQSRQLAKAYANRSAVLYQLGSLSECIQDIDRLHNLKYPDILRATLYVRRIYCSIILGHQSIQDKIKETQEFIEKMSFDNQYKEELLLKLKTLSSKKTIKEIQKAAKTSLKPKRPEANSIPPIKSCNKEIPYASDAVALKYNEHYGRHIVATRDISPGEVITIEKSYASMLRDENKRTHCSNCLKHCWAVIPCTFCAFAMYCSKECKDIQWKKCHDVECAIYSAMSEYEWSDAQLLSMRIVVLAVKEAGDIKKLKAMLNETHESKDPRTKGFSENGQLHNDKYISVYSLLTHFEKRTPIDLFTDSLASCIILYYFATHSQIFGERLPEDLSVLLKNDDAIFFASLILRHQQIISCNGYTLMESRGFDMNERAITLLPFYSYINHNCYPNVIKQSRSEDFLLYAARPIRKDEQIFDCYGDSCGFAAKEERQQKLFKRYYFHCDCIACEDEWPLYDEMPLYDQLVNRKTQIKIGRGLKKWHTYADIITTNPVTLLNKSKVITDLIMMIKMLYNHLKMPCCELFDIEDTFQRIYDLHGNVVEIPEIWWRVKMPII